MAEPSLGQKISWFLYQKGMGVAKPEYLSMVPFASPKWFEIADILIKDKHLEGRDKILNLLLQPRNLTTHAKRPQFMQMIFQFLAKGILDERRKIVKFIDQNAKIFTQKDAIFDALLGALLTAQRDSDHSIANTAESAYEQLKGDAPNPMKMRDRG